MRKRRMGWRYGLVGVGVLVSMAGLTVATVPTSFGSLFRHAHPLAGLATAEVRKTDLYVSLTTGGRVDSTERTTIECQLEALEIGIQGKRFMGGGASTILSIIADGSTVKEDDVLAILDSSDYEELVRTQTMNVERAESDHLRAELSLQIAQTAVTEYRDGLYLQNLQTMEGQIALNNSDYERALDRLDWSRQMLRKGYLPKSQVSTEEFQAAKLKFGLNQSKAKLGQFRRYSAPIYQKILDSDVKMAEVMLNYQDRRLQRNRERLEYLEKQVKRCTIRAPHDGFVIYANEENRGVRIEPGMAVRQKQRLFYLPDLSKMEVAAIIHESVVKDVKPGMLAKVTVEALAGRVLEGHVTEVTQLPVQNSWFTDIRYFIGVVKLDTIPRGLLPGMTAEIAIQTVRRPDVLAVPPEALTMEEGRDVCYVAHDDHVERREVRLGQATPDLLEVTAGLHEGDAVVLDPTHLAGSVTVTESHPTTDHLAPAEPLVEVPTAAIIEPRHPAEPAGE